MTKDERYEIAMEVMEAIAFGSPTLMIGSIGVDLKDVTPEGVEFPSASIIDVAKQLIWDHDRETTCRFCSNQTTAEICGRASCVEKLAEATRKCSQ